MTLKEKKLSHLFLLPAVMATAACTSIDCPLNNRVYTNYCLQTAEHKVDTMKLYMTVSTNRTEGSDTVIINKDVDVTQFSLPISNAHSTDVFFVELADTLGHSSLDTISVSKEDHMHFESTDCAPSYFHTLTNVSSTHNAIDSVVINTNTVDYDTTKKHFYIYFTPRH